MSYADDLEALINAMVNDKASELAARMTGKPVPGGVGSSLGGTSLSTDGVIDQGENSGGGGGDGGNEGLEEELKIGDEPEKFKLFDCDTEEEVTIDGLGGGGAGPAYPTGFEECKGQNKPTLEELIANNVTIYRSRIKHYVPSGAAGVSDALFYYASQSAAESAQEGLKGNVNSFAKTHSKHGCDIQMIPNGQGGASIYMAMAVWKGADGLGTCEATTGYAAELFAVEASNSVEWKQAYIDNWDGDVWPAVDRNHLVWNEEKECMEPLCPDLNNQVSEKYQGCNDEMVLCDEEGNKVKVKIENGEMKVTQAKFGKESTIKDGKVQSTKNLTPEQLAREFK